MKFPRFPVPHCVEGIKKHQNYISNLANLAQDYYFVTRFSIFQLYLHNRLQQIADYTIIYIYRGDFKTNAINFQLKVQ